jgi:hypothetical protein
VFSNNDGIIVKFFDGKVEPQENWIVTTYLPPLTMDISLIRKGEDGK